MGEVMVPLHGGSEAYFAYAAEPDNEFLPGTQVLIVDESAPRTVYVTTTT